MRIENKNLHHQIVLFISQIWQVMRVLEGILMVECSYFEEMKYNIFSDSPELMTLEIKNKN